ncbi:unnamed protein product [Heligmosomoides polygyrus]|uniref:7TM_GPCR_Srx domain-containing protein n=1 Tax=Heligmosomoides polygyrus TaxID=6339 RepID=A0A183G4Y7_HELPZ|nr:unnamed protein product [Heligmosomoides polygyrus]
MNYQSYTIPSCMIAMYVVIYVKLKVSFYSGSKHEANRGNQEIKYLIQTVLIGVLIIIEVAAFITVPFLGVRGYGQFYLNILLNLIIVANNLVTPVVLFAFNTEVQKQLIQSVPLPYQSSVHVVSLSATKVPKSTAP